MEGIIVFFIVVAIAFRLAAGGMDGDRVESYIRSQGGVLIDKQWAPFGKGWVGEKNARIYQVRYRDSSGNIHEATVKTSMFSGVYFTEDRIVSWQQSTATHNPPMVDPTREDLETENARLRRRIAELENPKD